jgi:hypothetical protein
MELPPVPGTSVLPWRRAQVKRGAKDFFMSNEILVFSFESKNFRTLTIDVSVTPDATSAK